MGKIEKFTLPIEPLHQSPRKVWVYLPDSYATSKKKYPVLYMFDVTTSSTIKQLLMVNAGVLKSI